MYKMKRKVVVREREIKINRESERQGKIEKTDPLRNNCREQWLEESSGLSLSLSPPVSV